MTKPCQQQVSSKQSWRLYDAEARRSKLNLGHRFQALYSRRYNTATSQRRCECALRPRPPTQERDVHPLLKRNGVRPPIFDVEYGIGGGEGSLSFYKEHLRG